MVSFLLTAPLANNPNLSSSFKMCFEQHYKLLNLNLFCVSIHYIFETFFFFLIGRACACYSIHVEVRGQLMGVSFLFLPRVCRGWKAG